MEYGDRLLLTDDLLAFAEDTIDEAALVLSCNNLTKGIIATFAGEKLGVGRASSRGN